MIYFYSIMITINTLFLVSAIIEKSIEKIFYSSIAVAAIMSVMLDKIN